MLPLYDKAQVEVPPRIYSGDGYTMLRYGFQKRTLQKKPFNVPSPYRRVFGQCTTNRLFPRNNAPYWVGQCDNDAATIADFGWSLVNWSSIQAKAYDNFKDKIYSKAELGLNFVEASQSLRMIARSASTLIRFTRDLKRLDFAGAANTLGTHVVPKGVSTRKAMANNWLEYYFGWKPLIHDIYDACEVVNNPIKSFSATRGGSSDLLTKSTQVAASSQQNGKLVLSTFDARALQGGQIEAITNGNLFSLEQFGLLNPASLVWEAIPFSFVVDWFANVGQVLASYSDFAGMSLKNTYTTQYLKSVQNGVTIAATGSGGIPVWWTSRGVKVERALGLALPSFSVKKLKLPSKERAATAVSLLTQIMAKR